MGIATMIAIRDFPFLFSTHTKTKLLSFYPAELGDGTSPAGAGVGGKVRER